MATPKVPSPMIFPSHRILIIGGGVVGAMLAYELSKVYSCVTLLDKQTPAHGATGAALGVLMGVISRKTKGRAWAMRQHSIARYDDLVPELQRCTGQDIDYNQYGIVKLLFEEDNWERWQTLAQTRKAQGWPLELWHRQTLQERCPGISLSSPTFGSVIGAVYSCRDRQIHPQQLTLALLEAACRQGAQTRFDAVVHSVDHHGATPRASLVTGEQYEADWIILTAGLGTSALASSRQIDIRPVLGQAMEVALESPLDSSAFRPVITGNNVHIVSLQADNERGATYWVGATVEFPQGGDDTAVEAERQAMWEGAIALCPALSSAAILKTWWGKRPRPHNRPAPVIERLPDSRVIVASGHYRNGVLLAPATVQKVMDLLQAA